VRLFHVDKFNPLGVRINALSKGEARELVYSPDCFDYKNADLANALPPDLGFSGFRVMDGRGKETDWLAFQGASYFRTSGEENQYGASARGIAINTAMPKPEEFPRFVEFWLEEPQDDKPAITIYALLDGTSIAGAYRFECAKGRAPIMTVSADLYARTDIDRVGVAPLTSMFWYGENDRRYASDWRPEIHDSDGLAIWTGGGEHIWRPLNNPSRTMVSSFVDTSPRGFGLCQRDRNFDHYQDGVRYHLRPSAWVEPLGDWGKGAIQLTEIPTDDEIHDNIVAMWVPAEPTKAGGSYDLKYRLHWLADEPFPSKLARCTGTRLGNGGQPGQPRPKGVRKFMVEFKGEVLSKLPFGVKPEPVLSASRGTFSYIYTEAVPDDVPGHWRAQFDLAVEGNDPVEMRCYLRSGEQVLSETWLYQYHPF
jgi:glucans biosynthesis protein